MDKRRGVGRKASGMGGQGTSGAALNPNATFSEKQGFLNHCSSPFPRISIGHLSTPSLL